MAHLSIQHFVSSYRTKWYHIFLQDKVAIEQEVGYRLTTQIHLLIKRLGEDYISVLEQLDYARETTSAMTDLIDLKYTSFLHEWHDVISLIDSLTRSNVRMKIENIYSAVKDIQSTKVVLFDPNTGELQTNVYLPVGLKSLKSPLPNINLSQYTAELRSAVHYVRETTSLLYGFHVADVKSWIPPFTASASITNGLVTTFDGTVFTMEGKCSYLLAGDFSVVMEILGKQKVKVVVTTHLHTINLSPRKQVRIDGALLILPYRIHDIYVTKVRDDIIITGNGFRLKHNITTETYNLSVSGWFLGKTAGLFGTYDNEPYNDMMMSNGEISNNSTTFRQSWGLSGYCL
ncbi:uncharacterized protein LOC117337722 [Pecten maximus]|uniref:uncharacterized protein LOC117337722 n=1 Tax=Pecten maximus TaxID=6579 RepID=UPI001458E0DB|nr:uncharacterized protein LOC117337722 [Pecten maximus]